MAPFCFRDLYRLTGCVRVFGLLYLLRDSFYCSSYLVECLVVSPHQDGR